MPVKVMTSAAPNARQTVPNVSTNVTAAYIPLLGSFTGDIWHVAAAQILWEHKVSTNSRNFPFPNFRPVTAITVPKYNPKAPQDHFSGGSKLTRVVPARVKVLYTTGVVNSLTIT